VLLLENMVLVSPIEVKACKYVT